MAAKVQGVWGIDIGQAALKAIRLEKQDGAVVATAFDYVEHPKILSQPDAEPDQLIRDALSQFVSRNSIQGDIICMGVPGQTGLARFVKLPPVEAKKIPDIVKFEAKQQIPFPLEEVVWDWQRIGKESGEDFQENEVGLFAMKKDMVTRYMGVFKDMKIDVHIVQMNPLSLCNFVAYDLLGKGAYGEDEVPLEGEKGCIVAVDVGVDNTNLVVTDGDKVIWQRPIPIGGNHFTRALTKEMKLTFAKAEHLKRNATKAEDPKKIFQCMRPVFGDFVGELQRSLGFFTNTHRNANVQKIVALGNAFRLPGLQKFVAQSIGMDVDKIDNFLRLSGSDVTSSPAFADNVLSFPVAYGLALQGLHSSRIKTNLLPEDIRKDRLIRGKKPWALAAAAGLLGAITIYSWSSGASNAHAKKADQAGKDSQGVITQKKQLEDEYNGVFGETRKARQDSAMIIRGSEERVNWPMFYRLLNDCQPQPNGRNLINEQVIDQTNPFTQFFTFESKRANTQRLERLMSAIMDDFDQSNLIQINITAVYSRFCDVPMAVNFYNNAQKKIKGTPIEVYFKPDYKWNETWRKPPDKAGWAIEIRGYTFHKDRDKFINAAFAENLKRRKVVAWPLQNPSPTLSELNTSHVAILEVASTPTPPGRNVAYEIINKPLRLNGLVGGSSAPTGSTNIDGAGAADPNNPPPGQSSVARGSWKGLGSPSGSGSGTLASDSPPPPSGNEGPPIDGLSTGTSQGQNAPSNASDNSSSGTPPPAAGAADLNPNVKPATQHRTEFIIVMYWVEPLPTETPEASGLPAAAPPPAQ